MSIKVGCVDIPCSPWPIPPGCCDACETPETDALFGAAWAMVTQWLFVETCYQFPGSCPVETDPCPPCGCPSFCGGCGSVWDEISLSSAFCYPILWDDNNQPLVQFWFPDVGAGVNAGPDTFQVLPGGWDLDIYGPLLNGASGCCGSWPISPVGARWSIRAVIGAQPPALLLDGAARLACEIVKDCQGKESCLPDNVRSIVRRGLTMDVGPNIEEEIKFDTHGTGIPILDMALRTWGCREQSVASHFDPLAKLDERYRRVWTFKGRAVPNVLELSAGESTPI